MSEYADWRRLEKEFRDFQRRYPNLYAAWFSRDDQWTGFGGPEGEEDRFRALLGLAAATAGHSGGDGAIDHWLNLVKGYLLGRSSKNITSGKHAWLARPLGVGPTSPGMNSADPMVEHGEILTIRPLCRASADYCLERMWQVRSARRTAQANKPAQPTDAGTKREEVKELEDTFKVQPESPRRRGRPAIAMETKRRAWEAKQKPGNTNKDVAKILYGTQRPTLRQVKNVPTILKYYQKSIGMKKS